MFKTDETVRFGQILSARTLRYGKFNEYIIIIINLSSYSAIPYRENSSPCIPIPYIRPGFLPGVASVLVRLKKQKCIPSAEGMGVALTIAFAASSEILEQLSVSSENTGGGLEDWRELGCLFPPAMAPRPAPRRRNLSIVKIDFNFSEDLSGKHCVYGGFPGFLAPSLTSRGTAKYTMIRVIRK